MGLNLYGTQELDLESLIGVLRLVLEHDFPYVVGRSYSPSDFVSICKVLEQVEVFEVVWEVGNRRKVELHFSGKPSL